MPIMTEDSKTKIFSSEKIKRVYSKNFIVYSSGNIVTYVVDGTEYQEEVDEGESVLSPKTFTPTKTNYIFVGWSLTNNGDVLVNLTMGDDPITLYAKFINSNPVNFSYTGGMKAYTIPETGLYLLKANGGVGVCRTSGAYGGKTTYYAFLNKGTVLYVGVGGSGTSMFNGGGQADNDGYGNGGGATHWGMSNSILQNTAASNVLCVAGGSGGTDNKYNSAAPGYGGGLSGGSGNNCTGGTQNSGGTGAKTGSFGKGGDAMYGGAGGGGWYGGGSSQGSGGNQGAGAGGSGYIKTTTTSINGKTYTNSTVSGGSSVGSASIQFIEPLKFKVICVVDINIIEEYPIFSGNILDNIQNPSKDGYTFVGWKATKTADSNVLTSIESVENIVLYAVFQKNVTLTNVVSGESSSETKIQYYNNGVVNNPTFYVSNPNPGSGYEFRGWTDDQNNPTPKWSSISNTAFANDTTIYALRALTNTTISSGFGTNNMGGTITVGGIIFSAGTSGQYAYNGGGTINILSNINCSQYEKIIVPIYFEYDVNTNCSQSSSMKCGSGSTVIFSGSRGNETTHSVKGKFSKDIEVSFTQNTGVTTLQFVCSVTGSNPYNLTYCTLQSAITLIHRSSIL